jgi:hypothetical protein
MTVKGPRDTVTVRGRIAVQQGRFTGDFSWDATRRQKHVSGNAALIPEEPVHSVWRASFFLSRLRVSFLLNHASPFAIHAAVFDSTKSLPRHGFNNMEKIECIN